MSDQLNEPRADTAQRIDNSRSAGKKEPHTTATQASARYGPRDLREWGWTTLSAVIAGSLVALLGLGPSVRFTLNEGRSSGTYISWTEGGRAFLDERNIPEPPITLFKLAPDHLLLPRGTPVQVLEIIGEQSSPMFRIEVVGGPFVGRKGWVHPVHVVNPNAPSE